MAFLSISLVLHFLLLGGSTAVAKDSWNIDCGGTSNITAANGLIFQGDGPYIRTGESRQVSATAGNVTSVELSTLRAFPRTPWKKNCYRVPVEPGAKVLVRAQFYYGNYDGLDTPPKFNIYFDTAVGCAMTTNSTSSVFCEVVYVTTKKQGTSICLVQTWPDQFPFVSTIEIQRLNDSAYGLLNFSTAALFLSRRFAFGANQTIEYPDDAYNRIWDPNNLQGIEGGANKAVIVRRENTTAVDTSRLSNAPPKLLFQAAAVAPMVDNRTSGNLTIRTAWLSSTPSDIYFTMYYTEVASDDGLSAQSQNRTFRVFMDGQSLSSTLVLRAETGVALGISGSMYKASEESAFDLVPAEGSTLPPALSGMEVFLIAIRPMPTDSNDVEALAMLQSSFTILQNWSGDPCRPKDYHWEWVDCNYPNTSFPRVTKLLLSGFQLSGSIPDFSSLDALEYIDFSNNSFSGSVPEFLASLPNLKTLDLSDNDFDSIPTSLRDKSGLELIIKGNPKLSVLSTSPPAPPEAAPAPTSTCNQVRNSKSALFVLLLATAAVM